MDKLKKLAARIIGCKASPFKEGDEEQLIAFGEERLAAMADDVESAEADGDGDGDDSKPDGDEADASGDDDGADGSDDGDDGEKDDADSVKVSQADYDEMQDALAERRAARQSRQKALATKIVAKTDVYKEADLLKRPVEELEQLAKALQCDEAPRDYSAQGTPIHEDDESVPPPPDQAAYARALKGGKSRQEAMEEARQASTTH